MEADPFGNVYIAMAGTAGRIRKVSASGIISTLPLNTPYARGGMVTAGDGALFFSTGPVYRHSSAGALRCIAGNGTESFSGDGGPASRAQVHNPEGVAPGPDGSIYIADTDNHRVRRIDAGTGIITTVAGTGTAGFSGDGGPGTGAMLDRPTDVAVDGKGRVYIADRGNRRVRRLDSAGRITTVAGNGDTGFNGDGIAATAASLGPAGIGLDAKGRLYIADNGSDRVRKVRPDGIIVTVAGKGKSGRTGDGGPARKAAVGSPQDVAVDAAGSLFIVEDGYRIRKVDPLGIITTVAGNGEWGDSGDGGPAVAASLAYVDHLAVCTDGTLWLTGRQLRRVDRSGIITTVVTGDTIALAPPVVYAPGGVACATDGVVISGTEDGVGGTVHRWRQAAG